MLSSPHCRELEIPLSYLFPVVFLRILGNNIIFDPKSQSWKLLSTLLFLDILQITILWTQTHAYKHMLACPRRKLTPFSSQSDFDEWVMAGWLARCPLQWVVKWVWDFGVPGSKLVYQIRKQFLINGIYPVASIQINVLMSPQYKLTHIFGILHCTRVFLYWPLTSSF